MPDINALLGVPESYKAPEALMNDLLDGKNAHILFMRFLDAFHYDVSFDWFYNYFEDEHSDRRVKKQDFTPSSLAKLMANMMGGNGLYYEPAAGTGGIIIKTWWNRMRNFSPFEYSPSTFFVVAEEMSERAIPFLLFNLMIRGIDANVVHCNSLTRECKDVYFLWNEKNDHLRFSKLFKQPHDKRVEQMLNVKFVK